MQGIIKGIYVCNKKSEAMQSIPRASVISQRGIDSDRYHLKTGTFAKNGQNRGVTLIEIESVWALKRDYQIEVHPKDLRRNLLTQDIALNHFVGKQLQIGTIILKGIELCEPCGYLSKLLNLPLKEALKHRGGLRCKVLVGGSLFVGETIKPYLGTSDNAVN